MDTKKIGIFLKDLRNENGMTQEQLGQKLGVSNKTISRWETGKYMPPVESLNMLSDIYNISINEILAGERVSGDEFAKIAEENITAVLAETRVVTDYPAFQKILMFFLVVNTVLSVIILTLLPMNTVKDVIVMVLVIAVWFISNTLNLALNVMASAVKEVSDNG